jgi:predicted nucleic acid-binding protein
MNCGLTVVGTIGVLLRAKQLGLCSAIEPMLDRLQREINFFISPALRQSVLQQANELSPPPTT